MSPPDQNVAEFYDRNQKWFTRLYSDRKSLGLHYGFWDHATNSRAHALTNQYRVVAGLLEPKTGQRFLDAGCGVGGAALWLAEHSSAEYVGISLSSVQISLAKRHAQARGLTGRVTFERQNYFQPNFPEASFDGVFGVESFCYSYPAPEQLFRAMFRILKPGGKFVMSDGVLVRPPETAHEQELADNFVRGYAMRGWCTPQQIKASLVASGFRWLTTLEQTEAIRQSVHDIHRRQQVGGWVIKVLNRLGLASAVEAQAILASSSQAELYASGLLGYMVFTARKPEA